MFRNILIVVVCLLSAYLIYGSFSDEEEVDLKTVVKIETVSKLKDQPVEVTDPDLMDTDEKIASLNGIYSLYLVSNVAETKQEYVMHPDNTFEISREIVVPTNDGRKFFASGTYSIIKNEVALTLDQERNRNFFPDNVIRLKMLKNGNLKYDTEILERQ